MFFLPTPLVVMFPWKLWFSNLGTLTFVFLALCPHIITLSLFLLFASTWKKWGWGNRKNFKTHRTGIYFINVHHKEKKKCCNIFWNLPGNNVLLKSLDFFFHCQNIFCSQTSLPMQSPLQVPSWQQGLFFSHHLAQAVISCCWHLQHCAWLPWAQSGPPEAKRAALMAGDLLPQSQTSPC